MKNISGIHTIYYTPTTVSVIGATNGRRSAFILHTTPRIVHAHHMNAITSIDPEAPDIASAD